MRLDKSFSSSFMLSERHEDGSHSESRYIFLLSRNPTVSFNSWKWNQEGKSQFYTELRTGSTYRQSWGGLSPRRGICPVCVHAKSLQSCLTLCDPMDCSPLGSSVHEILQPRIQSGLPFPLPGDLPDPGIECASLNLASCIGRWVLYH